MMQESSNVEVFSCFFATLLIYIVFLWKGEATSFFRDIV